MKFIWIVFAVALISLVGISIWNKTNIVDEPVATKLSAIETSHTGGLAKSSGKREVSLFDFISPPGVKPVPNKTLADSLVQFALSHRGIPYLSTGTTPAGFDCSGFIHFAFARFGINLPHSSALLAHEGVAVSKNQARKGDLVIFTGTQPSLRTPGHVGIVISNAPEPLVFVHASSNGGVKISKVDSTGYERRYLQVRRVF